MNKNKFLVVLIGLLVVVNLLLIFLLIQGKGPRKKHEGPRDEIIAKLKFDPTQVHSYDELIKEHQTQLKDHQVQMRNLKNQLYEGLKLGETEGIQDSILKKIAQKQIEIEQTHLNHFRGIQKICKPNQQSNFNELLSEIAQLFSPHPPPKKLGI